MKAIKAIGEQLRGKTAIAGHNTDHELTIFILAKRGGVDPVKEMKWIDMTPPEGLAAFLTGTGDLYNGGIPQRLKGVEEGNKLLVTLKDLKPEGINFCGFATTKKFAQEHMDLLTAFQRVAYRNHAFIDANPDQGFEVMKKKSRRWRAMTSQSTASNTSGKSWSSSRRAVHSSKRSSCLRVAISIGGRDSS